ncbi:molybdopterin molybdotransferase MoeA [Cellvibrio sp. OA-2007]|uniref:molybdopterin molybdotransferase MoeA n=1 Tax=Cellvibrio sp. OA-2007 TaxID=529823 RepID=UPI0007867C32|nr:gephyrin-like molybdotransferase Glp [Cellvibrio sp. OA-2007]
MDCCAQLGLLPVEDALLRMQQQLIPVQETEWVDVALALDRVLAEAVLASINVPASDNSAMDGYALRGADAQTDGALFEVIGQSLAGHPFCFAAQQGAASALGSMQAVRIMTGAMIPAGADTVVMQENVTRTGETLQLNTAVVTGDNIRRAGEDIKIGSEILSQGHRISALDIGLLASLGIARVKVWRKLRIAVLSTGDELLPPGAPHNADKIYDSNRPLLCALLQRLAVEVKDVGIVADDLPALRTAFTQAMQWADLVISSGGVSVGDADYTKAVLAELGEIDFWKIAMKPGKPFAFGRLGAGWFVGLPGNPVSTAVTYHQLVVPAVRYLAGEKTLELMQLSAIAEQRLKKQPGRMDFQRGILINDQGVNRVVSAGSQSSGVLSSMAKANCYIRLEAERGTVQPGETVTVIPFDKFIS